jgi:cytoskeletal protein CcmA (bactofilin family)
MFTKKTGPEPKPVASARNQPESSFSVLGADTLIKGDLSATADLHVDGRIEGDIDCGSIVQGESSEVVGGISAESARLAGTVRGSITTRELVILKTAHIHGDVQYDTLTIEQGAVIEGRLSPRGSAPAGTARPPVSEDMLILTETAE